MELYGKIQPKKNVNKDPSYENQVHHKVITKNILIEDTTENDNNYDQQH